MRIEITRRLDAHDHARRAVDGNRSAAIAAGGSAVAITRSETLATNSATAQLELAR
jgi:hypothetical protein